ncbi:MAG: 3-deoxy-manno-octulosonate cytidylyltransferase [Planctomycetota bacterium]
MIPARLASSRLPDKPLAPVGGRPLIAHVIENARRAQSLDELIVATDAETIAEAARAAGATAVLTDPELPSGSDRIAAALRDRDFDIAVNVQGDEPEIAPKAIDAVVNLLAKDANLDLATAASSLGSKAEFLDPNRVKVVLDDNGRALYFSRAPIPFQRRDGADTAMSRERAEWGLGHIGLYAYRRSALFDFVSRPPSALERTERLEQLRALQAGMTIGVVLVAEAPPGIDTPKDLAAFARRWAKRQA